jgi:hypothetical protein
MNSSRIATLPQLLVVLVAFVFSACTDDPLKVGLNVLPNDELLNAKADTLQLECYTVEGVPSYVNYNSDISNDNFPLGFVNDPVFGKTSAETVIPIQYNTANYYGIKPYYYTNKDATYYFDTSDVYLSCRLYLNINKNLIYAGNGFEVEAIPLAKKFSYGHPSNYVVKSDEIDFTQGSVSAKTIQKYYVDNKKIGGVDSGKYYLIVEFEKEYGKKFMDSAFIKSKDLYSSDSSFSANLHGFYLRAKALTEKGGMNNIYSANSRLVLEYSRIVKDSIGKSGKNATDIDTAYRKTLYSTLTIGNYNTFYKNESNTYPAGPFGTSLNDTINELSTFNVQSLGGVRGYVKIKGLDELKNKKDSVGVNYAELVFPINTDNFDSTYFFYPKRLTVTLKYGNNEIILDDNRWNAYYFDGFYNNTRKDYRINITEYVHQYLSGKYSSNGFYVYAAANSTDAPALLEYKVPGRICLNSGVNKQPSFLRVIYTKTK